MLGSPWSLPVLLLVGVLGGGVVEELQRVFILTRFRRAWGLPGLVLGTLLMQWRDPERGGVKRGSWIDPPELKRVYQNAADDFMVSGSTLPRCSTSRSWSIVMAFVQLAQKFSLKPDLRLYGMGT